MVRQFHRELRNEKSELWSVLGYFCHFERIANLKSELDNELCNTGVIIMEEMLRMYHVSRKNISNFSMQPPNVLTLVLKGTEAQKVFPRRNTKRNL